MRPWRAKTPEELEKEEIERRAKLAKKAKPDFYTGWLVAYPQVSRLRDPDEPRPNGPERLASEQFHCLYKPGHWTSTTLAAKANHFDFVGELEIGVRDRDGRPLGMPGMPYTWTGVRQVALPKGQLKTLEGVLLVPPPGEEARVDCWLNAKGGRRITGVEAEPSRLLRMPAYQFHLVVLARLPERYAYLKTLDSVGSPWNLKDDDLERAYYRVSLLEPGRQVPLPSHALFWTSIACLIWDDLDADVLRPEQQVALLDWLHWGGQLIVNGPGSLERLANSFLGPYLPAAFQGSRKLNTADLEELNQRFTPPHQGKPGRRLSLTAAQDNVRWTRHPDARFLPGTGELLVERRVGRGRIVATAFGLHGSELVGWPGFDGLFNACLLGRPPRKFLTVDGEIGVTWADDARFRADPPGQEDFAAGIAPRDRTAQLDARRVSNLRYFSRDALRAFEAVGPPSAPGAETDPLAPLATAESDIVPAPSASVASWSDFHPVANAARQALQTAARIEIPGPRFVLWVVGVYLLVLVPLNWLVFRMLGRVEWSWAAAPIIAVVCTVAVIRLAQLDIGFARSLTELAVVELEGGYPRAHVTRYTAMYTSLSTRYKLEMEDAGGQVAPFSKVDDPAAFRLLPGEGRTPLRYVFGQGVSLQGFEVLSNSTGLAHGEQMVDLGGAIVLEERPAGGFQVVNHTCLTLQGVGVIRNGEGTGAGRVEAAWVGTLEPEAAAPLRFRPRPADLPEQQPLWHAERNGLLGVGEPGRRQRPDLSRLMALAERSDLAAGEVRLVGWVDAKLPGMDVLPAAPQSQHVAVVLAHLRRAFGPDPERDANARADVDRGSARVLAPEDAK